MEKNNYDKVFKKGDCVSEELLLRYVDKVASPEEQHIIERHTLECDMCSDILEGLLLQKNQRTEVNSHIQELGERIDIRIKSGSRQKIQWYVMAAAASITLLIGVGIYLFNQPQTQLAENILPKAEEHEAVADKTKDTLTPTGAVPEINQQEENPVDKNVNTKLTPPKITLENEDLSIKEEYALSGGGNAGQGSAKIQQYSVPVFEKDNSTTGGTVTAEDINTMAIRDVSGIASYATSGDNYVNEDSLVIDPEETTNDKNELLADEVTPKYHTRGARSDNPEILLSEPSLSSKSKRANKKEVATEAVAASGAAISDDIINNWPFVNVNNANAYILETSLSVLNFNEIGKTIKAKSVSVSPDKLVAILDKIQSAPFTTSKPSSTLFWKYVVLLRNDTQKEVAYIAISEDGKNLVRYPDAGYSSSGDLISFIKLLFQ